MSEQPPEIPDIPDRVINVPCSACGSEMVYDPQSQGMLCDHCGNKSALPRESDMVVERSFSEGLELNEYERGFALETKVFHCNNCGSNTAVDPEEVSFSCPFCASKNVNEQAFDSKTIRPSGIGPFKIDRGLATQKFKTWIGRGWFRPSNLKKLAKLAKIHSVYLPFWTYDANTQSQWWADAGYYYYTTETYTDSNGNTQVRQVRHTRWVPVNGYHQDAFNDVLILGSHGIQQSAIEKIFPFDLEEVVNYDSRFILGHESEVYQKDVKDGFDTADKIMDARIEARIKRKIPGDTQRYLRVNTRKSRLSFKHLLLPVWLAAYQYNKKSYQFMVNGQTGDIAGKKPLSWIKILMTILLVAGTIAGVVYLINEYN